MSVFVDTSAIYAGLDRDDPVHGRADEGWRQLIGADDPLMSHALVEVETVALVQARLGFDAVAVLRDRILPLLHVIEVDRELRRTVLARLDREASRAVSLVDRVSFELMRRAGIERAFAFDRHFSEAGFELVGGRP